MSPPVPPPGAAPGQVPQSPTTTSPDRAAQAAPSPAERPVSPANAPDTAPPPRPAGEISAPPPDRPPPPPPAPEEARRDQEREPAVSVRTVAVPPSRAPATALPPEIASLPPGAEVSGVVAAQPEAGLVVLRTEAGPVRLDSPVALNRGSHVVVQITGADSRLTATVVSIDGRPPPGPLPAQVMLSAAPVGAPAAKAAAPVALTAPARVPPALQRGLRPGTAAAAAAAIGTLPAGIAALTPGSRLAGTVSVGEAGGPTLLDTAHGRARIDGGVRLRPGSRIVVEVNGTSPRLSATLLSIDGRAMAPPPPTLLLRPVGGADATAAPGQGAAKLGPGQGLAPGTRLTATVITPARPAPAAARHAAAGVSPARSPSPLAVPAGTRVSAEVRAVSPAAAAPEAAATSGADSAAPRAQAVSATVVGTEAGGALLLNAADATIRLDRAAPLPVGSKVELSLLTITPAVLDGTLSPLLGLPDSLETVRETVEVLATVNQTAAQHVMQNVLPNTTASGLANLIAYFLGIGHGDARRWLGDRAAKALERAGRADLIERLGEDLRQIGHVARDSGGGDWRAVLTPFFDGENLHQILIFLRERHGQGGGDDAESEGTRLVVDVELSRLGAMQLDGLYNRRRFDLFVRSRKRLGKAVRRDILEIFDNVTAASGLNGRLTFQVRREFPVDPLKELSGSTGPAIVA